MPEFLNPNAKKCIACRACEVACEREHDGVSNVQVAFINGLGAVPVSCRHCQNSPCSAVCPHNALSFTPEGDVALDRARCTNCGLCMFACPFGAIYMKSGKIAKCDFCAHRRKEGKPPACFATCPTGAVGYGKCEDFSRSKRLNMASRMAWS